LWTLFVLVSLIVGVVWAFGIGEGSLQNGIANPDLLRALSWILNYLDFVWIILAAANSYIGVSANEGLSTARRWAVTTVIAVVVVALFMGPPLFRTASGHHLVAIRYSGQLGPKLGLIPLGLPLLWLAAVFGARDAVLWGFPRASLSGLILGTGTLVALTDFSIEPVAARLRGFWFWQAGPGLPPVFDPPAFSFLKWGLLGCLLVYSFRGAQVSTGERPRSWKPLAIFGILHIVFLAGRLGAWIRD
jgi:hypothetical protein